MTQEHYYTSSPKAKSSPSKFYVELGGRDFIFYTNTGVFSKNRIDRGSMLMIQGIHKGKLDLPKEGKACDLGCGYGAIGIFAASFLPSLSLHMVDVNERAVELAKKNVKVNNLDNITVELSDGLKKRGYFDYILCNPPVRLGKKKVQTLLCDACDSLKEGGCLAVVIRTQQGAKTLAAFLNTLFKEVKEVDKGGGFRLYQSIK